MALHVPKPKMVELEKDGVKVSLGATEVVALSVDGVPFCDQSSFYIVKPGWSGRIFGYEDDRRAAERLEVSDLPEGGRKASVKLRSKGGEFEGVQTFEVLPGRVARFTVEATVSTSTKANLEHRLGGIYPAWCSGRPYEAVLADGTKKAGVAPTLALTPGKMPEATLASRFTSCTLDTRAGTVVITASGDGLPTLADYRKNQYAQTRPYYWFGVVESKLEPGKPFKYSIEVKFPPARPEAVGGKADAGSKPVDATAVLEALQLPDRIFPTPKQAKWGEGVMPVAGGAAIRVAVEPGEADKVAALAEEFAAFVREQYGADLKVTKVNPRVRMADPPGAITVRLVPPSKETAGAGDEQYGISVTDRAMITAPKPEGVVNALKTMRQLVRMNKGGLGLRRCEVKDWPALPMRGIHLFSGKDARRPAGEDDARHPRRPEDQSLVYQCEYIKWDMPAEDPQRALRHGQGGRGSGARRGGAPAHRDRADGQHLRPQRVAAGQRHLPRPGGQPRPALRLRPVEPRGVSHLRGDL